ncbi:MAG: PGPGW domain-containing protein, partial [Phycisphaerales bacterium]
VIGPLGLAILATEFAWARRLLGKFDERTEFVDRYAPWIASPWAVALLVLAIIGYWVAAVLVVRANPDQARTTWIVAGVLFLPISAFATVIALTARRRWHAARESRRNRASINRSVGE